MDISKTLKHLLVDRDINVTQLSRATDVPRQTIDNWIAGQEPRSLMQLKQVSSYFDLTIDELCFGKVIKSDPIEKFEEEINAGLFEVVLRRVKK